MPPERNPDARRAAHAHHVQVTEDILSPEARAGVFADLTAAFLKHHNLTGNAFLTPNVIGEVNEIPRDNSFAGGKRADIAIVELKVPSFAFASPEQKQAFIANATNTLVSASKGRLTPNCVWVNVVYAVDGLWGIGGRAYSNDDLLRSVSEAATPT